MVEGGGLPGCRRVAGFAGCAFSAGVHILSLVAGEAGGGCVGKLGRGEVTLGAQHAGMSAHQREHLVVVEG